MFATDSKYLASWLRHFGWCRFLMTAVVLAAAGSIGCGGEAEVRIARTPSAGSPTAGSPAVATSTPTERQPQATATNTDVPDTPVPTATAQDTPTTAPPLPTATNTEVGTSTPRPSRTPTNTPVVDTPTPTRPTATLTNSPTNSPTETRTSTRTNTRTPTTTATLPPPTNTTAPTATFTEMPTGTPVGTATATAVPTGSAATMVPTTAVPTDVPTDIPTTVPTSTFTPIPEPTETPTEMPANELGTNRCTLSEDSILRLNLAASPLGVGPGGAFDIVCGAVDEQTQRAECGCEFVDFDPIPLLGIGDVCISSGGECPAGQISCNAGRAAGLDFRSDHNIGTCTSNTNCNATCDSHCSSLGSGFERGDAGCEGFCISGPSFDAACVEDADCPDSSCPGKEPFGGGVHQGVCNCTCIGRGSGAPGPAGTLDCNLGLQITVERDNDQVCFNTTPSITLPPICGALTTAGATGELLHANNGTRRRDVIGPLDLAGVPATCEQFSAGSVGDTTFVGNLAFYDSTLGDILTEIFFVCE